MVRQERADITAAAVAEPVAAEEAGAAEEALRILDGAEQDWKIVLLSAAAAGVMEPVGGTAVAVGDPMVETA